MAEELSSPITLLATEALEANRFVKLTSGSGTYCEYADTGPAIGVTRVEAAIGQPVSIELFGSHHVFLVESAGAITVGAAVYVAADGKVDDASNGIQVGLAMTACTDAGQLCAMLGIWIIDTATVFSEINDTSSNESLGITATASAVNYIDVINSATTDPVILQAAGDDTNISFTIKGKGSGTVTLMDAAGCELLKTATVSSAVNEITVKNAATGGNPIIMCSGEADTGVTFMNVESEEILILDSAATSVNEVTIASAATGVSPSIKSSGGDTHVSLELGTKGTTSVVHATAPFLDKRTQTATAGGATLTVTIAQLLTKIIDATPTEAQAMTLPTAALLVAGITNCKVGDSFDFLINNKAGGAYTITVGAGSGGTGDGTLTVAQNVCRRFTIFVTNVTGSSEAYYVYGNGD
jgi:hypothetical protein